MLVLDLKNNVLNHFYFGVKINEINSGVTWWVKMVATKWTSEGVFLYIS